MLPHALPRPLRRLLAWTAWCVAGLVLVVVAAFLYVTFVGVTVDAAFLRGRVAQAFSENLGRDVRFDGPMEFEVSARPKLRVGGLHIANPPGFGGGDYASLGEARLALDLWPLLFRKQLHIQELSGSDVRAHLQLHADGTNNWTLRRPRPAPRAAANDKPATVSTDEAIAALDIQSVKLDNLQVRYIGPAGREHFFTLANLEAQSRAGQPFGMRLQGAVEKEFPYRLEFTGGALADLARDRPWPVDLKLTFLSSTLVVHGEVNGTRGRVTFGLGTQNLLEFQRMLQARLPDVGASGIAGTVEFEPGRVRVTQLAGAMGATSLIGHLDFDDTGTRPKISGELALPALDLRPFLGEKPAHDEHAQQPANLGDVYRSIAAATFSLKQMGSADLDLTLAVQRWLSLPGDVRDVTLQLKLEQGVLHAPLGAAIAGVQLKGSVDTDATAEPPRFKLELGTADSDLGGLAELLAGVRGIKGHLGRFALRLAAQGDQGAELVRSLDIGLDIERGRFSYGNVEGGRPVEFALDKLALRLPAGKALDADMRGDLLGHAFAARLRSGALEPIMLQARAPLDFTLRSGDVRAHLEGALEPPAANRGPDLAFAFSAPHAGELAGWFGFKPGAEAPASLSGKASMRAGQWAIRDLLVRLGRTTLAGELGQTLAGGRPLVKVRLGAGQIDVKELESLLPKSEKKPEAPERPMLDIPLLPQGIDLSDADIDIGVKRFAGSPVDVRDVSFNGRIREGYMHASPFSVTVADTPLTGAVLLDLRGAEPSAGLWLYASNIDAGRIARDLGVVRNVDATFSEFGFNLIARASRLGDMLARSELTGMIGGGRIVLRDPNTHGEARVAIDKGDLRAQPGQPLTLEVKGSLDEVPVLITVDAGRAEQLADPRLPLAFRLDVQAADSDVALSGNVARPIGSSVELALQASGKRFDSLDRLARASLPPWGPWSATGRFRMSPNGYEVDGLRLQVGQSVLEGNGKLRTDTGRPRIDVSLTAPLVQLDDFRLGGWSPVEKKPDAKPQGADADVRAQAAAASDQAQKLLSPEMLRRQDAHLKVEVAQVLSGQDKLGSGRLEAKLENGRADIGPLEVDVPGGGAKLWLGYEPTEQDVKVDLHIDVQKFDYGVLARRIKPETDVQGAFSLKVDVDSRARYLSEILRHGNGRIEFAVWPKNMQAGIFDLWAVNVLVALVPAVDPGNASKVNCAVGRFALSDGKLTDRTIVMDTSRMRVTGKGRADFAQESFNLHMSPQAKTAQFLSLATPVEVGGTFDKFSVGVSAGDVLGTVGRLVTSIVWVPLQKLAGKKIPADGADVCHPVFGSKLPSAAAR